MNDVFIRIQYAITREQELSFIVQFAAWLLMLSEPGYPANVEWTSASAPFQCFVRSSTQRAAPRALMELKPKSPMILTITLLSVLTLVFALETTHQGTLGEIVATRHIYLIEWIIQSHPNNSIITFKRIRLTWWIWSCAWIDGMKRPQTSCED